MENMLRQALWGFLRPLLQLVTNLLNPEIGEEWLAELKLFLRKEPCWVPVVSASTNKAAPVQKAAEKPTSILRLISGGESIVIPACDGSENLANADDVFNYIDGDFKGWGLDFTAEATPETPASIYEMAEDADLKGMFSSFNTDLDKLAFSQHQIKKFAQKKKTAKWLRSDGWATFFLFKKGVGKNAKYFVASVHVRSFGGRGVYVHRLEDAYVWDVGSRHCLVVPQLDT